MVDQADTKPALLMRTARENPASYFEKIREAALSLASRNQVFIRCDGAVCQGKLGQAAVCQGSLPRRCLPRRSLGRPPSVPPQSADAIGRSDPGGPLHAPTLRLSCSYFTFHRGT